MSTNLTDNTTEFTGAARQHMTDVLDHASKIESFWGTTEADRYLASFGTALARMVRDATWIGADGERGLICRCTHGMVIGLHESVESYETTAARHAARHSDPDAAARWVEVATSMNVAHTATWSLNS